MAEPTVTCFREWMPQLKSPRSDGPDWPWVLHRLMAAEYVRQRERDFCYAGEVFKDRDDHPGEHARKPENKAVYTLYHRCGTNTGGVFRVGRKEYWLLGYEWPNQRRDRGARADLVGLTRGGGLAVFEVKLVGNGDRPLPSALQGLDYLSCLTSVPNFAKVAEGFAAWSRKGSRVIPPGFTGVVPSRDARHEVVVLADEDYYRRHGSPGGAGWELFAAANGTDVLSVRFAACDFASGTGRWVPGGTSGGVQPAEELGVVETTRPA